LTKSSINVLSSIFTFDSITLSPSLPFFLFYLVRWILSPEEWRCITLHIENSSVQPFPIGSQHKSHRILH
jgi:hypothetical protein